MKALINSWNDADTIKQCIESLKGFEVHVFDGKYKDFPAESLHSTDGTKELAKSLGAIVHDAVPDETQCQKRTRMMTVVPDGEYFLRIDADEILLNPEVIPRVLKRDVYWAWEISNIYPDPFAKPRIYKKLHGMHISGRHHYFFDRNNDLIASDQYMGKKFTHQTIGLRIFNMRHLRSSDRDFQKNRYRWRRDENLYNEHSAEKKRQDMIAHPNRAPRPRMPMEIRKKGQVNYTMSLLFTRDWAVDRYFDNLDRLWIPDKTEIICIVDSDDRVLYHKICRRLLKSRGKFSQIKTYLTKNAKAAERSVTERRRRISRNMNIMLTEARGSIILGSEDDSLAENVDTYKILLKNLEQENADFVQGTIVGRWEPIIPAWHVELNDNGDLIRVSTGEKKTGLEEIQGCGWYGYAAKADVMRKYAFHTNYCSYIGPDFHHGFDMWKGGAKLLHNHDLPFIHFGQNFNLKVSEVDSTVRHWKKTAELRWKPA